MKNSILQIQPQYEQGDVWREFVRREGLFYEAIEFSMPQTVTDPLFSAAAQEWYRDSRRVKSLHGAFIDINPASGDPAFRQLSRTRCHESCQLARELGASHAVFHSSCFPFLRETYLDHWAVMCAEFFTELAQKYDLMICVENSQDVDPAPLCALMDQVTDERVRVCLDIGHANYSRTPLEDWFDRLGAYIGYLHLSDNMGKFDDHLPLGRGTVDWKLADSLWRQLDREMPITLEVGGIGGVEQSLAYLKQRGYFGTEG